MNEVQSVSNNDELALSPGAITGESGWLVKVMIGSMISYIATSILLFNFIFLPLSVALMGLSYGYLLRVMRAEISAPGSKLPEWNNWLDLMISGISWTTIALGFYFCGLGIASSILIYGVQTGSHLISDPRFLSWAMPGFIAVFALYTVSHFFCSVLMANFAQEESMVAGFAWRKVWKRVFKKPFLFLNAWMAAYALNIMATFLPALTVIFLVLTPFLVFFAQIIGVRLIARAWRASADAAEIAQIKAA